MKKILVKETLSTNTFLLNMLNNEVNIEEGTVVCTHRQTAGRGQIGNKWESENDKNIAFSVLLRPTFLPIREQFFISEITSLAVVETLASFINSPLLSPSIKWPNDIYINDGKVCGMLIENTLMGSTLMSSVVGVGININQTKWISDAPNPTSLCLCCDKEFELDDVMDKVLLRLEGLYEMLKAGKKEEIHSRYLSNIYRRKGYHSYKDATTGRVFLAKIKTIEPSGYLVLEDTEGSTIRYLFKEVKFVLPCGVTKE